MIIRNNKIELRAIEPEDYKKIVDILRLPPVWNCLLDIPLQLAEMTFDEWFSAFNQNEHIYFFSVKDRSHDETVGVCAYQDIDYRNGSVTVWAVIDPEKAAAGLITEALKALVHNAFHQLRMEYIALYCLENDSTAQAAAINAGFFLDAVLKSRINKDGHRLDLELYSLIKEEAEC